MPWKLSKCRHKVTSWQSYPGVLRDSLREQGPSIQHSHTTFYITFNLTYGATTPKTLLLYLRHSNSTDMPMSPKRSTRYAQHANPKITSCRILSHIDTQSKSAPGCWHVDWASYLSSPVEVHLPVAWSWEDLPISPHPHPNATVHASRRTLPRHNPYRDPCTCHHHTVPRQQLVLVIWLFARPQANAAAPQQREGGEQRLDDGSSANLIRRPMIAINDGDEGLYNANRPSSTWNSYPATDDPQHHCQLRRRRRPSSGAHDYPDSTPAIATEMANFRSHLSSPDPEYSSSHSARDTVHKTFRDAHVTIIATTTANPTWQSCCRRGIRGNELLQRC